MTALQQAVVVGGRGAVGALFADLLRDSGVTVTVVDRDPGDDEAIKGDITAPDTAVASAVAAADLVVLAVPEPVALRAVEPLAGLLRPGAVLADTLSVKSRLTARLTGFPAEVQRVGLNPMFAPDLGMAGRPVAAVVTRGGSGVDALLDLVRQWGGCAVHCTPDEHDATAAATQALTHAAVLSFGLALARMNVPADRLSATAPPPHLVLLALLARITNGRPEVYLDVQEANPHAARARHTLAEGLRTFAAAVEDGEAGVAAAFGEIRALLGAEFVEHQRRAHEVFKTMHCHAEERR